MTDQPALFDATATVEKPCPVPGCQAIRLAGQHTVITCAHDLDIKPKRRPKACLNTYRPEHAAIPF